MGWQQAFSGTAPKRIRDKTTLPNQEKFESIFGDRPGPDRLHYGWSMDGLTALTIWAEDRRDFVDTVDAPEDYTAELNAELLGALGGGSVHFWKSVDGTIYMAVVGISTPITRGDVRPFGNPNFGRPLMPLYQDLIQADVYIPNPPTYWGPSMKAANAENAPED